MGVLVAYLALGAALLAVFGCVVGSNFFLYFRKAGLCCGGISSIFGIGSSIVGSVFGGVVGGNFFLHFGKTGLCVGSIFGIGCSVVRSNFFLHFGKAGLCRGGVSGVWAALLAVYLAALLAATSFSIFGKCLLRISTYLGIDMTINEHLKSVLAGEKLVATYSIST